MNYRLENLGCGDNLRSVLESEISEQEIALIESTIRPFIQIKTVERSHNLMLPWESRFGGKPYLTRDCDYPYIEGKPAQFIAQINFAEVPVLEDFPRQGILQFYLVDKPLYEWNYAWFANHEYANLPKSELLELAGAKILFFPEPSYRLEELRLDFEFLTRIDNLIIKSAHCLNFERQLAPMDESALLTAIPELSANEYFAENYDAALQEIWQYPEDDELMQKALDLLRGNGHRLGGYPGFLQCDPRRDIFPRVFPDAEEPYDLLFRMTGQSGIELYDNNLYFLIQRSDLQRQDFSNVLFYCDR